MKVLLIGAYGNVGKHVVDKMQAEADDSFQLKAGYRKDDPVKEAENKGINLSYLKYMVNILKQRRIHCTPSLKYFPKKTLLEH